MTQVIFQPVSNSVAQRNLAQTIHRPVPLAEVLQHVDTTAAVKLSDIYTSQSVYFWGVASEGAAKQWKKLAPGDFVLFADSRGAFLTSWVSLTLEAEALAKWAWESDPEVGEFRYIYFLHGLRYLKPPLGKQAINLVVGNSHGDNWMSFRVNSLEKSARILDYLSLDVMDGIPISRTDFEKTLRAEFKGKTTDAEGKSLQRKEQSYLRRFLFEGKEREKCAICGEEYPIEFLVTAHLKKRASCSHEERLDVQTVVAPMCRFGCDELYERGFVAVVNGEIVMKLSPSLTPPVHKYLKSLRGKKCALWPLSKSYFEWHARTFGFENV